MKVLPSARRRSARGNEKGGAMPASDRECDGKKSASDAPATGTSVSHNTWRAAALACVITPSRVNSSDGAGCRSKTESVTPGSGANSLRFLAKVLVISGCRITESATRRQSGCTRRKNFVSGRSVSSP
jgi:hypothetical protein